MRRNSKNEVEKRLDVLEEDVTASEPTYDPEPLSKAEKDALNELFSVDPGDVYGASETSAIKQLHERYGGRPGLADCTNFRPPCGESGRGHPPHTNVNSPD